MGTDIHVIILKKELETNAWKQVKVYIRENNNFIIANPYPYRNYELFDTLSASFNKTIVLKDLPYFLAKKITKIMKNRDGYDFSEVNLADLKIYSLTNQKTDNLIKPFIEKIENYIKIKEPFYDYSDIKILYWFDN